MTTQHSITASETSPDEAKAFELAHLLHDLILALALEYRPAAYSLVRLCAANPTRENLTALVDHLLPKHEGGAA